MVDLAFNSLIKHLESIANGDDADSYSETDVKYAVITLLCRVIVADGVVVNEEVARLKRNVVRIFGNENVKWQQILDSMQNGSTKNEPIFATTAILLETLDAEKRQEVVNMMVDIAFADGEIAEEERAIILRAAEMLKVESGLSETESQ